MKVLLISSDNIYLVPYIKMYTNLLDQNDICYDVLYWDKNRNEMFDDEKFIRFSTENDQGKKKILGYLEFRKKTIELCKNRHYDLLVPLHPICNIVLYDILTRKYKGRYVFDVRDYSYEKYGIIRWMEKQLVKSSMMNIISSEGYKNFLPQGEYHLVHNIPQIDYEGFRQTANTNNKVITISYIGLIRFMEQNKKIILFFKNDPRFHLNFIGTNASKLQYFCEDNGVDNVTLIDTFPPEDTLNYYKTTDLIMNLYGNHTPLLDYALSNKLYFAACLYKPILVCSDTYMEKITKEFDIGYSLKLENEDEKNRLYQYIKELKREQFITNCNALMNRAITEQQQTLETLKELILKG